MELARLGPGELFGEMSLLSGAGATATVRATVPTVLLLLAKPYFDRLLEALPDLRDQLEQLADRARARSRPASRRTWNRTSSKSKCWCECSGRILLC